MSHAAQIALMAEARAARQRTEPHIHPTAAATCESLWRFRRVGKITWTQYIGWLAAVQLPPP